MVDFAIKLAAFLALLILMRLWYVRVHSAAVGGSSTKGTTANSDYMVDSQTAGPRPYDTVTMDRKTANELLMPRRFPTVFGEESVIGQ